MGEQHANGSRVSRRRLAAGATAGVIANPMPGRDIRRLVASASVFPNAEKALCRRRSAQTYVKDPDNVLVGPSATAAFACGRISAMTPLPI